MRSPGVAAVTAFTAHGDRATRPPDERFASVLALSDAARIRRERPERAVIETRQVRTAALTEEALAFLAVGRDRGADKLELRAARWPSRRAAGVPPNAARADRV